MTGTRARPSCVAASRRVWPAKMTSVLVADDGLQEAVGGDASGHQVDGRLGTAARVGLVGLQLRGWQPAHGECLLSGCAGGRAGRGALH